VNGAKRLSLRRPSGFPVGKYDYTVRMVLLRDRKRFPHLGHRDKCAKDEMDAREKCPRTSGSHEGIVEPDNESGKARFIVPLERVNGD
jgi:hypothetical protein